jgi:hypothetical protein
MEIESNEIESLSAILPDQTKVKVRSWWPTKVDKIVHFSAGDDSLKIMTGDDAGLAPERNQSRVLNFWKHWFPSDVLIRITIFYFQSSKSLSFASSSWYTNGVYCNIVSSGLFWASNMSWTVSQLHLSSGLSEARYSNSQRALPLHAPQTIPPNRCTMVVQRKWTEVQYWA